MSKFWSGINAKWQKEGRVWSVSAIFPRKPPDKGHEKSAEDDERDALHDKCGQYRPEIAENRNEAGNEYEEQYFFKSVHRGVQFSFTLIYIDISENGVPDVKKYADAK